MGPIYHILRLLTQLKNILSNQIKSSSPILLKKFCVFDLNHTGTNARFAIKLDTFNFKYSTFTMEVNQGFSYSNSLTNLAVYLMFHWFFFDESHYVQYLWHFRMKTKGNIGVTFLGKFGLSFHIEIRGFLWISVFRSPQFFKIHSFWNLQNLQFSCRNPRILQSWGLGLSSSKVFQTKDQWWFKSNICGHF